MAAQAIFRETARIRAINFPVPDCCSLVLEVPRIAESIKPGQFVNVLPPGQMDYTEQYYQVHEGDILTSKSRLPEPKNVTLLRRPFSLHGCSGQGSECLTEIALLFRILGRGTALIAGMKQGDKLDVLGPLGNPYPLPPDTETPVFIVAGGYGVAPLLPFARLLKDRGNPIRFFWGIEAPEAAPLAVSSTEHSPEHLVIKALEQEGIYSRVAVNQKGTTGFRGTVIELFKKYIEQDSTGETEAPLLYTCGPEIMMQKVQEIAESKSWKCRVSLEKYMACGIGACLSCVCKAKKPSDKDSFYYLRTCTDGPSFWGDNVIWD